MQNLSEDNSLSIREILENLGYSGIKEVGRYLRTKPIYRNSDNYTSLSIDRYTGLWKDFSEGISGDFYELIRLSLGLSSVEEAQSWFKTNANIPLQKPEEQPQKPQKIFSKDILESLKDDHSYWQKRGISIKTAKEFHGGVCDFGRMANRYIFPIFNSKGRLIGLNGRDLTNKSRIKYKILGNKSEFIWPAFINKKDIIQKKEVIFVESAACVLSLFECGIRNVLCLFGTNISKSLIQFCLRIQPREIIIATNNEPGNNSIGNTAADKIRFELCKFFDQDQVSIKLPKDKDISDQLQNKGKESIIQYYGNR